MLNIPHPPLPLLSDPAAFVIAALALVVIASDLAVKVIKP